MTPARSPLGELASLIRDLNAAARDRAQLNALLDTLCGIGAFQGVAAFAGNREKGTFVVFAVRDCTAGAVRTWSRWPLRRLFVNMHVRRIVHPDQTSSALAIPFDFGAERCIVLAVISEEAGEAYDEFFEAAEHIVVPCPIAGPNVADDVPLAPVDPQIVAFGLCPSLSVAVEAMVLRRAWTISRATTRADLHTLLDRGPPDMLLFDAAHLADAFEATIHLHTMLPPETRFISFSDPASDELVRQGLVDAAIAHDAGEADIFATLKPLVRDVPELRRVRLQSVVNAAESLVCAASSPVELSAAGAWQAAELMCGWASLHLVTDDGAVYAAEHPDALKKPLLRTIPKAFLSDRPLFQLHADDRFFAELSEDIRVRGALACLEPVSAAAIPLRQGDRRFGALAAVSCDRIADAPTFEALENLARIVSRRFADIALQPPSLTLKRSGIWDFVCHGRLEIAVYRSRRAAIGWDYRAVRPDCGILAVGTRLDDALVEVLTESQARPDRSVEQTLHDLRPGHPVLLARIDPQVALVSYAAYRFPAPRLLEGAGPSGTISSRGGFVSGNVAVPAASGLLLWDEPLRNWMAREGPTLENVTEVLEDLRPPGLAIVVTVVGGERSIAPVRREKRQRKQ